VNADLLKAERELARGNHEEARVHAWNAFATIAPEEAVRLRTLAEELGDEKLLAELDRYGLASEEPKVEEEQRSFRISSLIFPLAITTLLLVLAVNSFASEATAPKIEDADTAAVPAQPRPLLTERVGVWLVRIGDSERVSLQKLADDVSLRYGVPVAPLPQIDPLPDYVVNQEEEELDGDLLLALLAQWYGVRGQATIIGITDYPMWSGNLGLQRPFMLRARSNYAVISTADLGAGVIDRIRGHTRYERTRKLVGRGIGFLYLLRPISYDDKSLLRRQMSGTDDIDALDERL
jgi:hypothetical protein